jgi:hypothetical protein
MVRRAPPGPASRPGRTPGVAPPRKSWSTLDAVRRVLPPLLVAVAFLGAPRAAAAPPTEPSPDITRADLERWVKRLASDDLEGRETGTPGCDAAAEAIAAELARLGLVPKGDAGGWMQEFTVPRGTKVLPTCVLEALTSGPSRSFELGVDWVPMSVSSAGAVDAEVVFAGYGISAPDLGYDDYAGVDVTGKVVVVLRHAPDYEDAKSPFGGKAVLERYGSFQAKAEAAAGAGAKALVVVNDPKTFVSPAKDVLRPAGGSTTGKIPVVQMTWKAGRRLGSLYRFPFAKTQLQIDGKVHPRSEVVEGARLRIRVDLETDVRRARNVIGLLEGAALTGEAASRPRETVLVGAHYDHVGRGHFGSLSGAPGGKIHNGADDNASGTAALLEIAGWLASRRSELRRPVLFLAFSGEELGLLGSKHYVERPVVPLSDSVAMVNLDMVGRSQEGRVFVGGTGTSPVWPALLERSNESIDLRMRLWPGGKAPSDHKSFYEKDLPVLFFFTGIHSDYHRPTDDWNTLAYPAHERVARLAAAVVLDLATRPERPPFTKADAGGFEVGPRLGVAIEQKPDGVTVVHVEKGSPASKAGFKEGDVLLEWNGKALPDTNAVNDVLSQSKPRDKVEVVVRRKGKTQTLEATLGNTS